MHPATILLMFLGMSAQKGSYSIFSSLYMFYISEFIYAQKDLLQKQMFAVRNYLRKFSIDFSDDFYTPVNGHTLIMFQGKMKVLYVGLHMKANIIIYLVNEM